MEINILKAKNGEKILKVDNFYMNSSYNPTREAEVFIKGFNHLINDDVIHVIGLGLGYHIKELLKLCNDKQVIKVLDINENLKESIYHETINLRNKKILKYIQKKICKNFFQL